MTKKIKEITRLLVVSHDTVVLRAIWLIGESNDWQIENATSAWKAIERIQVGITPDLLLLDLPHDDEDGLHILRWLRRLKPALPIILIGHSGDIGRKQEAIRMGARDYLLRPFSDWQLEAMISQYLSRAEERAESEITSDDVEQVNQDNFFIGISPVMRKLRAQISLLAEANVPVLILGERGSGKETAARLLHKLSVRSGFEFARVNCAALPSDLLERELFGHPQNGNGSRSNGKLELCAKGTILLHEITEMSLDLQSRLLEILRSRQLSRFGDSESVALDVRILATSSSNMEHAIAENRLLEDFYYRLSAYTIHVPPLRERRDELPVLSRHFMHQLAKHYRLSPREFSPAVLAACQAYMWPGNLRELENFVKRYLMVGDDELTSEKNQASAVTSMPGAAEASLGPNPIWPMRHDQGEAANLDSLKSLVQSVKLEAEKNAIAVALEKTGWNRKAAARLLKVSYRTLLYKIEQYQMRVSDASLYPGSNGLKNRGTGFRSNSQTD